MNERVNEMGIEANKIYEGDALEVLRAFPDNSINMCMTSPPYWALRDYGSSVVSIFGGDKDCEHNFSIPIKTKKKSGGINEHSKSRHHYKKEKGEHGFSEVPENESSFCSKCGAWKGQLGLEPDFDMFISHLCDIFDGIKRVLTDDGSIWVNIGDTYYTKSGSGFKNDNIAGNKAETRYGLTKANNLRGRGLLPSKCLTMIPFRFAIEMVNRGWILRNTIIWHKPNSMPSSAKDRFNVDFEYLFFFSKKKKYYFETQYEPLSGSSLERVKHDYTSKKHKNGVHSGLTDKSCEAYAKKVRDGDVGGRTKRTIWKITTKPFPGSHFAVYPEKLCETPIKAGCPEKVCKKCGCAISKKIISVGLPRDREKGKKYNIGYQSGIGDISGSKLEEWKRSHPDKIEFVGCDCNVGFNRGIVLDPFFGAGTTGLVALKLGRNFVGIELNPEYIKIAEKRLKPFLEQKKLQSFTTEGRLNE